MEWYQIPLGPLQTNCYIITNESKQCLIIDPGSEGEKLKSFITNKGLNPQAIILTHAHFDHIGAVDDIRKEYNISVYIHVKEEEWLTKPELNGSQFFMLQTPITAERANYIIEKENEMKIGDFSFQILETPGHSPGSISFYFKERNIVVSGDALFSGSIGRTDLPGGNHKQLLNSIHERLLILPEETIVLPGHGPTTTIGQEMDSNPFLNGF